MENNSQKTLSVKTLQQKTLIKKLSLKNSPTKSVSLKNSLQKLSKTLITKLSREKLSLKTRSNNFTLCLNFPQYILDKKNRFWKIRKKVSKTPYRKLTIGKSQKLSSLTLSHQKKIQKFSKNSPLKNLSVKTPI